MTWYPNQGKRVNAAPGSFETYENSGGSSTIINDFVGWYKVADFVFTSLPTQALANGANTVVDSDGNSWTVTVSGLGAGNTAVITNGTGLVINGGAAASTQIFLSILCASLFPGVPTPGNNAYFTDMDVAGLVDFDPVVTDLPGGNSFCGISYRAAATAQDFMGAYALFNGTNMVIRNFTTLVGGNRSTDTVRGAATGGAGVIPGRIGAWFDSASSTLKWDDVTTAATSANPETPANIMETVSNNFSPAVAWSTATDVMTIHTLTNNAGVTATIKRLRWYQR